MMEGTDAAMALQILVTNAKETSFNEDYTMIGENIEILRENFADSTAADKVWQIWGAATALGPATTPDFFTIHNLVEDPTQASQVRELYDGLISAVGFFGGCSAMAMTGTFWNYDDFNVSLPNYAYLPIPLDFYELTSFDVFPFLSGLWS
jgi:hypothetical protein